MIDFSSNVNNKHQVISENDQDFGGCGSSSAILTGGQRACVLECLPTQIDVLCKYTINHFVLLLEVNN